MIKMNFAVSTFVMQHKTKAVHHNQCAATLFFAHLDGCKQNKFQFFQTN